VDYFGFLVLTALKRDMLGDNALKHSTNAHFAGGVECLHLHSHRIKVGHKESIAVLPNRKT
jgi:hypothetical protein